MENKRNTSKEKEKRNRAFPYHQLRTIGEAGIPRYEVVDDSGKSYGKFRNKENALRELKRIEKNQIRDDLMIEHL